MHINALTWLAELEQLQVEFVAFALFGNDKGDGQEGLAANQ